MNTILDNIVSVSYAELSRISSLIFIPGLGVFLNGCNSFVILPIVGLASAQVTSQIENKSRVLKVVLNAFLPTDSLSGNRRYVFLLKTVSGKFFLLGTPYSPFPVINTTVYMPSNVSNRSGCQLVVECTNTTGLLPVLDAV